MNGVNMLVFLITAIGIAAIAAGLLIQTSSTITEEPIQDLQQAQPSVIQVQAFNISNNTANYIRIQVTSDEPVRINDTFITIVESDTASLRYRNGSLLRNVSGGFYTR